MTTVLSSDQIAERIHQRRTLGSGNMSTDMQPEPREPAPHRYIKPLTNVADGLVDYYQSLEGRFTFGLRPLDEMTRGIGRGELVYLTGRAGSGKSQVMLNAIAHNPDKCIIVFTPDEVDQLVLMKLVAIRHDIPVEHMERAITRGDEDYIGVLRAMQHDYPKLVIIDDVLSFGSMREAYTEVERVHGRVDAVFIDYLELLPWGGGGGDYSSTLAKSQEAKRWTKELDVPVIALRQNTRGSGERGEAAGMSAFGFGGENEATFVIEVFRKRESKKFAGDPDHVNSVTLNVAKNKRPPGRTGEVDMTMVPETGAIRPRVLTL